VVRTQVGSLTRNGHNSIPFLRQRGNRAAALVRAAEPLRRRERRSCCNVARSIAPSAFLRRSAASNYGVWPRARFAHRLPLPQARGRGHIRPLDRARELPGRHAITAVLGAGLLDHRPGWSDPDSPRPRSAGFWRDENHFNSSAVGSEDDLLVFGWIRLTDDSLIRPEKRHMSRYLFHIWPIKRNTLPHRAQPRHSSCAPSRRVPPPTRRARLAAEHRVSRENDGSATHAGAIVARSVAPAPFRPRAPRRTAAPGR
jgi:hypothetical protein